MKNVVLTFDYELFFGAKSGTVEECVIKPTERILSALKKVNGKAVFFIDYLMLKRLNEENDETRGIAKNVEEQLKEIVRAGSRIELHLHPHWVDAKYKGKGEWDFSDYSHYCLQSLPQDEITKMFVDGVEYLNWIAREVKPDYAVKAFRAGGWAIEPFSPIAEGFEKSGITIDSSVCKGMVLGGVNYRMNFMDSPNSDVYKFDDEAKVEKQSGRFTEVQISAFRFNPLTHILDRIYRKLNARKYKHYVVGSYMSSRKMTPVKKNSLSVRLFKSLPKLLYRRVVFSIDTTSKVSFLFNLLLSKRSLTVIMGHPKDINDLMLENIAFLGKYVNFKTYEESV